MSFRSAHRSPSNRRSPSNQRALAQRGLAAPRLSAVLGMFVALTALGCRKPSPAAGESKPTASAAPRASAAPSASAASKANAPLYRPAPVRGHQSAVGPELVIIPGKGVGAIRFGTNLAKLQQLMESPCDVQTETRCAYIRAASEFTLSSGVVSGMKFHRRDRKAPEAPASGDQYYGSFNGGMRPNIMFGLLRDVVIKEYGPPSKSEPLSGPDGQLQRDFYPGVILEYDRLENQNVVLSGIEVVRSDVDIEPPKPVKSAPAPKTPALAPKTPTPKPSVAP